MSTLAALVDTLGLCILLAQGLALAFVLATGFVVVSLLRPARLGYAYAVSKGLPGTPGEIAPRDGGARSFAEWSFKSGSQTLSAWDVPGDNPSGPVVVLTHGWGSSRVRSLMRVPCFVAVASRVILWDLRGHGESSGWCTLGVREVEDLLALIEVLSPPGVKAEPNVVLAGSSLGAGVSVAAAARSSRVIGVIAQAPYRMPMTPAFKVLSARGFPVLGVLHAAMALLGVWFGQGLTWARGVHGSTFDRAEHARRVGVPVLVLHGELDETSPIEDGRAIASAAERGEFVMIAGAHHNDLWSEAALREASTTAVRAWMKKHGFSAVSWQQA